MVVGRRLSDVGTFIVLTRSDSFGGTTGLLGVARPTLAQEVGGVRRSLRVRLFRHAAHGIALAGTKGELLPRTQRLVGGFSRALFGVHSVGTCRHNVIALTYVPATMFCFLPLTVNGFGRLCPGVGIQVLRRNAGGYVRSILYGRSSFNVGVGGIAGSSVSFAPLIGRPFILTYQHSRPLTGGRLMR